jgi:hypothetical protein
MGSFHQVKTLKGSVQGIRVPVKALNIPYDISRIQTLGKWALSFFGNDV